MLMLRLSIWEAEQSLPCAGLLDSTGNTQCDPLPTTFRYPHPHIMFFSLCARPMSLSSGIFPNF